MRNQTPLDHDPLNLALVQCLSSLFVKAPHLIFQAYELGTFDFQFLMEAVRDADPELALAGIDFWQIFITLDGVQYKETFIKRIFDQ